APEDPHGRIAIAAGCLAALVSRASFAIQKTLHIGQKAHKFAVVALMKTFPVPGVFVKFFAPRCGISELSKNLPGAVVRALCVCRRYKTQRPKQGLAKLLHGWCAGSGACVPDSGAG